MELQNVHTKLLSSAESGSFFDVAFEKIRKYKNEFFFTKEQLKHLMDMPTTGKNTIESEICSEINELAKKTIDQDVTLFKDRFKSAAEAISKLIHEEDYPSKDEYKAADKICNDIYLDTFGLMAINNAIKKLTLQQDTILNE